MARTLGRVVPGLLALVTAAALAQLHFCAAGDVLVVAGHFFQSADSPPQYPYNYRVALWSEPERRFSFLGELFSFPQSVVHDHRGVLFAGGMFSEVGETVVNGVAQWDGGNSWVRVGGGIESVEPGVAALATFGELLVVGGGLVSAEGVPVSYVAAWDGRVWSALGDGAPGTVRAIAVYRSELLIAGSFKGSPLRWSPEDSTWTTVSGGTNGSSVSSMVVWNEVLVICGSFSAVGESNHTVAVNRIAQWDSRTGTWSPLGDGLRSEAGETCRCDALAVYDGKLIAGGVFTTAGDVSALNVASWDGTAWAPLGGGLDGKGPWGPYTFASWDGRLAAGGDFVRADRRYAPAFAFWNGDAWDSGHSPGDEYWASAFALAVYNSTAKL